MKNSNNTSKILIAFTSIVFLFFIYEVMTNSSKVNQVDLVPKQAKQPSEIVINIIEKKNNNSPPVPVPVPVPVPPPVPPPVSVPVPVPAPPTPICSCRPIRQVCGECVSKYDPTAESAAVIPICSKYNNSNTCEAGGSCKWDESPCINCITYNGESTCNSATEQCFWGCNTR